MEGPTEKRLRKCGIRRKRRDNPDMASQVRASRKKRKMSPEAKELEVVFEEIKTYEEKLRLVGTMTQIRWAPISQLDDRIKTMEEELIKLKQQRSGLSDPDVSDLEQKLVNIQNQIDRLKLKAKEIIEKCLINSEISVDVVQVES